MQWIQELFPRGWSSKGVKLTNHWPRLIRLAVPLRPHTPSWWGVCWSRGTVCTVCDFFQLPEWSVSCLLPEFRTLKWFVTGVNLTCSGVTYLGPCYLLLLCVFVPLLKSKCVLNAYLILAVNLSESGQSGDKSKRGGEMIWTWSVVDLQDGSAWDLLRIVSCGDQSLFPPDKNKFL